MTARHVVASANEIPPGGRKIVEVGGRSLGIFNVGGRYYALKNTCPHEGGPLCIGTITGLAVSSGPGNYGLEREGEILRCPWHGWEFDILTGRSVLAPGKVRVKTYPVAQEQLEVETYPVEIDREVVVVTV
jgi:3-phenylpropionate/trans-cinnamate dioxygenase ferredoxin subunit